MIEEENIIIILDDNTYSENHNDNEWGLYPYDPAYESIEIGEDSIYINGAGILNKTYWIVRPCIT